MPEIEDLIRNIDPLRHAEVPSSTSSEAAAIYRRAMAGKPASWYGVGGRRPATIGGLGLVGVSAAVVAALVVPGGQSGGHNSVVLTLDQVAKVAAQQQQGSPLPAGEYFYSEAVGYELVSQIGSGPTDKTYSVFAPFTRQVWTAADGSGRLQQEYTGTSFLSPADHAAWVALGSPEVDGLPSALKDIDSSEGPGQLSPSLATLPTDAPALLADIGAGKVDSGGAPPGDAGAFQIVGSLLESTDASPALRAALYEVAAEIPGGSVTARPRPSTSWGPCSAV